MLQYGSIVFLKKLEVASLSHLRKWRWHLHLFQILTILKETWEVRNQRGKHTPNVLKVSHFQKWRL